MGRFGLAFKVFFLTLFNRAAAEAVREAIGRPALPGGNVVDKSPPAAPAKPAAPPPPRRSEAVTLLAALQREARFVDLVKEPLDSYSDDQIGAAARNVLRDCATVLDRFFDLKPVVGQAEGESLEVPAGYDPARFRVVGNVGGAPPFQGRVVHSGWQAGVVNLPAWTGSNDSAKVVAPAEVEV
jgi:hypothetical protein